MFKYKGFHIPESKIELIDRYRASTSVFKCSMISLYDKEGTAINIPISIDDIMNDKFHINEFIETTKIVIDEYLKTKEDCNEN